MIKSSKTTIKFANRGKKESYRLLISEYRKALAFFIGKFWNDEKISKFNDSSVYKLFQSEWMSARLKQCAAKQAAMVVKGAKKKLNDRRYRLKLLISDGKTEEAERLQKIIDKNPVSKPSADSINPELDYRFIEIQKSETAEFDFWIKFSSTGLPIFFIPVKSSKHMNKMFRNGVVKRGCRISSQSITLNFETLEPVKVECGQQIGIDLGISTGISCSNGQLLYRDKDGHSIESIVSKMSRLKPGSKAMERAQRHRDNFMHWLVKQISLDGIKTICIEKLFDMGRGKRIPRKFKHWNFRLFLTILKARLRDAGVQIIEVDPCCTSKRCSKCGRVRQSNRKGKIYKCDHCGNTMDADLNASINIGLNLPSISKEARGKRLWVKGFFWDEFGEQSEPSGVYSPRYSLI